MHAVGVPLGPWTNNIKASHWLINQMNTMHAVEVPLGP